MYGVAYNSKFKILEIQTLQNTPRSTAVTMVCFLLYYRYLVDLEIRVSKNSTAVRPRKNARGISGTLDLTGPRCQNRLLCTKESYKPSFSRIKKWCIFFQKRSFCRGMPQLLRGYFRSGRRHQGKGIVTEVLTLDGRILEPKITYSLIIISLRNSASLFWKCYNATTCTFVEENLFKIIISRAIA